MSQTDFATQLIVALTQIGVACGIAAGVLMTILILAIVFLHNLLNEVRLIREAHENLVRQVDELTSEPVGERSV